MSSGKVAVDSLLIRISDLVSARPIIWIASFLVATLALAALIPSLEIRTDGAALHPVGSSAVSWTQADRETFGEREQVIVLLSARSSDMPVASPAGFRILKHLHEGLDTVPELHAASVQSLASLVDIVSQQDSISLGPLLDAISDDPAEFKRLTQSIDSHPLGRGLMLGDQGMAAALYVHLDETVDRRVSVEAIEAWIRTHSPADFDLRLTGPVVAEVLLGRRVLRDLVWQVPIMVGVIALMLFMALRTLGGVIVPLFEALVVLCWTLGAMALFDTPVTLVTTILPIILMAISITDEIHLLQRFQNRLACETSEPTPDADRVREALRFALGAIERPIVITSLTTALGFLSFLTATIPSLRAFGVFTAFGILLAMALTFSVVPALIVCLPARWFLRKGVRPGRSHEDLPRFERFVLRRTGLALALGGLFALLAAPGVARLQIQDSWIANFDPRSPLVEAERDFNRDFWGTYRLDVVAVAAPEYFAEPTGAALVEALTAIVSGDSHVGGVLHYLVSLVQAAESLDITGPISELSRRQIADLETMLDFSGENDADLALVDSEKSTARLLVFVKSANYRRGTDLSKRIQRGLAEMSIDEGVEIHLSGDIPVALAVVRAIVVNQLRSIGLTVAGIALLLFLIFRSGRSVALTLLPVAVALVILFGGMGLAGMTLGIATSMFASLTVGIGVDFALHFQHSYSSARRRGESDTAALRETLVNVGSAIRWNVSVLAVGFSVLMLSDLGPNRVLGILLAAAMIVCYGTTVLMMPHLMPRLERTHSRH